MPQLTDANSYALVNVDFNPTALGLYLTIRGRGRSEKRTKEIVSNGGSSFLGFSKGANRWVFTLRACSPPRKL